MAASTTHVHDFAHTATGMVCSLCGATLSQAEILANKAANPSDPATLFQYIYKKVKG